jgi:transposase
VGPPQPHPGVRRALPPHQQAPRRVIAAVTHGLSNGLTESVNTKLRLLTRIAYGFRTTDNLIALCLLDRGGHCPSLPGRTAAA